MRPRILTAILACLALGACASAGDRLSGVGSMVSPYRIDILQGNVVTKEQAQALQPGLPRDQVRGLLGSPLLTSVFHADRWDYVFSFKRQGQPLQQRRLTVFFKGDVLERVESDELPSESEFVSSLDPRRRTDKLPPQEATAEQLKAFEARNASAPAPAPVSAPTPGASYPPLESPGSTR